MRYFPLRLILIAGTIGLGYAALMFTAWASPWSLLLWGALAAATSKNRVQELWSFGTARWANESDIKEMIDE
jgi:hypothetical protein